MSNRVVVITIEGLSTSLVGPYGSNTAITPALNALAARGVVLDQCFLDSRDVSEVLLSMWNCQHAMTENRSSSPSIWNLLTGDARLGAFITDCEVAAQWAERMGCEQVCLVDLPEVKEPAVDADECAIASLFTQAAAVIAESEMDAAHSTALYWIHTRGLRLPWDAPIAMRAQFAEDDEPEPPSEVVPPAFEVNRDTDPDSVVGWGQVAAAQVAVIDQAIDWLHGFLNELRDDWAWCIVGLGGVPLGEHAWVGWGRQQMYCEELQLPVVIVPHPPLPIGMRRAELSQSPDVGFSIAKLCSLDWPEPIWGIDQLESPSDDIPIQWPSCQQMAGLADSSEFWLRVPAWSLAYDGEGHNQLYVKLDDRWEANDVSSRCSNIITEMRSLGDQFFEAARSGNRKTLPALGESLCNLLR